MRVQFQRLAAGAARRPWLTLAVVIALAVGGALLATRLQPDTGTGTFVGSSTASAQATQDDHRHFGGDAVVILVREPLTDLVETKDLGTVSQLEACLAGQTIVAGQTAFTTAPAIQRPYGGWSSPCGKLRRARAVRVVYGPGTFLNRAVAAVDQQIQQLLTSANRSVRSYYQAAYQLALARHMSPKQAAATASSVARLAYQQQLQQLEQLAFQSGITGPVRIDSVEFIRQVVFDPLRGVNQPKARFSYLFPTSGSALIQVRLKPSLTSAQQAQAIADIRQAVRMPMFRLAYGGTYTVSGVPVVANDLATSISDSIAVLLVVALLVMAATLYIVFRRSLRLLPLAIALAACGITFGAVSLFGGSLTMASIAVLPILIGLAVDYAIQFQSRVAEEQDIGRAAARGGPTIAAAALATITGFLILQLSPVPMVRGFGLLLVLGILVAFACALTAGSAALAVAARPPDRLRTSLERGRDARPIRSLAASARGAGEILHDVARSLPRLQRARGRIKPMAGRVLATAVAHPGRLLAMGALLAALGWVADTQTSVQSDVTKLVPASMPALHDLRTLERVTGVSGEIDIVVHARDVATPRTIGWMLGYEDRLLSHFGYVETKGCSRATLCPALSLPDLFCSGNQSAGSCGSLSAAQISGLLSAVPGYFSQAVITGDRREATLAFGIRLMPLSRQQRVIDYMRSHLRPPSGITAQLAGLPVLAAQANASLASSGRRLLTLLAGLIAVGLVLLAVFRQASRALIPLVPIVLATGWSALVLFLIRIPLNPMSAAMGALVIAISTEFSVLLAERFRQERGEGRPLAEALRRTYRLTGRAVVASGVTAIAGFAVLIVSSITMLRDFGIVTLVDLSVSLAGVLITLPAVLALSEGDALAGRLSDVLYRRRERLPRLRRRATVA